VVCIISIAIYYASDNSLHNIYYRTICEKVNFRILLSDCRTTRTCTVKRQELDPFVDNGTYIRSSPHERAKNGCLY